MLARLVLDNRKVTVTQINSCNQGKQKSLSDCTSDLAVDGLQQQKTTLCATPVRKEQEFTIHMGSPKLDNRRLKKTVSGSDS